MTLRDDVYEKKSTCVLRVLMSCMASGRYVFSL